MGWKRREGESGREEEEEERKEGEGRKERRRREGGNSFGLEVRGQFFGSPDLQKLRKRSLIQGESSWESRANDG